jgi:hypothetical protein
MPVVSTFLNHSASKNLAQESILSAQIPRAQSAKRTRTVQNPTPFKILKPGPRLRSATWNPESKTQLPKVIERSRDARGLHLFEPFCKQKPGAGIHSPGTGSASAKREADSDRAKPNAIQNSEAGVSATLDDLERVHPEGMATNNKPACRISSRQGW